MDGGGHNCRNSTIICPTLRTKETDFNPAKVTPGLQAQSRPYPALNEVERQFSYLTRYPFPLPFHTKVGILFKEEVQTDCPAILRAIPGRLFLLRGASPFRSQSHGLHLRQELILF